MSTVRTRSPAFHFCHQASFCSDAPLDVSVAIAKASPGKSGGSSWPVGVLDLPSTCPPPSNGPFTKSVGACPEFRIPKSVGACAEFLQNSGFRGAKTEEAARIASSLFDRSDWRAAGIQAENSGGRRLARPSRPISTTSSSPRQSQPGTNEGQRHWPRNRA